MKKLLLFVLFSLIGSGIIKSNPVRTDIDDCKGMLILTRDLTAATIGMYGLGTLCKYKRDTFKFSDKHSLRNYKILSHTANVLLKTSSILKVPCFSLGAITLLAFLNSN